MKGLLEYLYKLCASPSNWRLFSLFILLDTILTVVIIQKVPYTEIDWKAYMEEVEGFLGGELDYRNLKGNTGPLVYPAGFLYIFSFFRLLTNEGTSIFAAQCLFAVVYILNLIAVCAIYSSTSVPSVVGLILILSKRIHSIYVLRMFNDCIAVLLGHFAIYLFIRHKWRYGSVLYSLSVSVKMNMLLYAPGLLLCLLLGTNINETTRCISICAVVQILLGAPFLLTFPVSYISKAFEFGRVFTYKWTVNFKFLPEEVFVSKTLSVALLILTGLAYIAFARKWISEVAEKKAKFPSLASGETVTNNLSKEFIIGTLFTSNAVGIIFARSLHYQFYCWYFYSLPFLFYYTSSVPYAACLIVLGVIEVCYNIYPSTPLSSILLQTSHLILLFSLYHSTIPSRVLQSDKMEKKEP